MIKKSINKIIASIFAALLLINSLSAQIISPFNKLELKDTSNVYSFIVSGHFHGASTNSSTFPASTLQANIDTLNSLHSLFLMSLGDMFLDVNETYLQHYQKSLFDKLKMPLFNSVGNHDVSNGNMYEKVFGQSYFTFNNRTEVFIVLNTEINDGSIKDDQLIFLTEALKAASSSKNIFVFSHRPIWSENNDRYKKLFSDNTRTAIGTNNFETVVKPLLSQVAKTKNIFWVSGSMGGGPVSFFYDKDPKTNITFMQTAIRDLPRDAVLQVSMNKGAVSFKGISLTGQNLDAIENYNIDYWNKTIAPEQKFNYRLLPLLTKQMLLHHYFWFGFITGILLIIVFSKVKQRWRKSK